MVKCQRILRDGMGFGQGMGSGAGKAIVGRYNEIIKSAVKETSATLIDLHSSAMEAQERGTDAGLISGDGLHPSTEGHRAVAESFSVRLEFP